jgi:hypothetical protein
MFSMKISLISIIQLLNERYDSCLTSVNSEIHSTDYFVIENVGCIIGDI